MTTTKTMPAQLGEAPTVHPTARIHETTLGAWTDIGAGTSIVESSVGDYTYIVAGCSVIYATIGKFCSIAAQVRINPGNHPMWRPTQHHLTYRRIKYGFDEVDDTAFFQWRRDHHVTIGHDVWIGHGAVIMPGVAIGTGAVIGAGAVVTHDVEPYTIAVGVPAHLLRPRFPREIAEALQRIAYWEWTREELEERFHDFTLDVDAFCEKYG